jgi:hypothetical protein
MSLHAVLCIIDFRVDQKRSGLEHGAREPQEERAKMRFAENGVQEKLND